MIAPDPSRRPLCGLASPERMTPQQPQNVELAWTETNGVRVLVADDDKMLSQMLCSVLRQVGHKATPAFDAVQVMMMAKRDPMPDLILLDINMPGGSGLKTLNSLKSSSHTCDIPIIIISGSIDTTAPDQARKLGAARFVSKPVDPSMLLQTIREVMEEAGFTG